MEHKRPGSSTGVAVAEALTEYPPGEIRAMVEDALRQTRSTRRWRPMIHRRGVLIYRGGRARAGLPDPDRRPLPGVAAAAAGAAQVKIEIHIATEKDRQEPWTKRQTVDVKVQGEDTARGAQPTQSFIKELGTASRRSPGTWRAAYDRDRMDPRWAGLGHCDRLGARRLARPPAVEAACPLTSSSTSAWRPAPKRSSVPARCARG
jgi:hypothetical protein